MFRKPITKEGIIRPIEVIKYTVLISFIFTGYLKFLELGITPVFLSGLKVSSVFVIFILINIFVVTSIEFYNLMRKAIVPIKLSIQSYQVKLDIIKADLVELFDLLLTRNDTYKKTCVIRC